MPGFPPRTPVTPVRLDLRSDHLEPKTERWSRKEFHDGAVSQMVRGAAVLVLARVAVDTLKRRR